MTLDDPERTLVESVISLRRELLMRWPGQNEGATVLDVFTKHDGSLVTSADLFSETFLREVIGQCYPGVAILSEEDGLSHRVSGTRVWIMDPLDGTKAFCEGSDDFAVLLSLREDSVGTFSICDFPVHREMVVAKGDEAIFFPSFERLPHSHREQRSDLRTKLNGVYCDIPGFANGYTGDVLYAAGGVESTRALLEVAKGDTDGVVVLVCGHKVWDLAALDHLVKASGGTVTDEAGRLLELASSEITAKYVVAANDVTLHGYLLQQLEA